MLFFIYMKHRTQMLCRHGQTQHTWSREDGVKEVPPLHGGTVVVVISDSKTIYLGLDKLETQIITIITYSSVILLPCV